MRERSSRHPFTEAVYELQDDGTIVVTEGDRQGRFTREGVWLAGDVRECDPQLCVWVANDPENPRSASDSHLAQASKPRRPVMQTPTQG